MKLKKETMVLLALIGVLSAYLMLRDQNRSHYQLPVQPEIKRGDFNKIEITSAKGKVILEKKDNQWHIVPQGFPVEKNAIDRMLDALQRITLTALISEAKDYRRYELEEAQRIGVKAWADGNRVRELEVGKTVSSLRQTFLMLSGDDRVYQARGNFQASFAKSVDELRDKLVLSFDPADIQTLTVERKGRSLTVQRKEVVPAGGREKPAEQTNEKTEPQAHIKRTQWETPDGRQADPAKVRDLLASLSSLRCNGYLTAKSSDDLQHPVYSVTLKGGKEYRVNLFEKLTKEATAYPGTSSGNDSPFLLPEWRAKDIMQSPEDLLQHTAEEEAAAAGKPAPASESAPAS